MNPKTHGKGDAMKKAVYLTLMGCLAVIAGLFSFAPSIFAAAPASYTLYIDGKVSPAQFPTVVESNTTLIPMKSVLIELNYTTTVDSRTKAITAKNSTGSYITVKPGSNKADINGSEVTLSAPVKALNGTTYIPLSAVRQLTGKSIGADASQGIAWIGEKPTATAPVPAWGVALDQFKAASSQSLLIDEGGQGDIYLLLYQDSPNDPEELYVFYKNKLAKVAFVPDVSGIDEAGLLGYYAGMLDSIVEQYGEPVEGSNVIDRDAIDQSILNQNLMLLANQGYLSSEWNVGNTKTSLLLKATDTGYTISMQFVDASVEAEVEAAMDAIE
ncbi:copper amine oxidase N-terminal domain-containing protein [Paenibacillus sp. M1]|uniref:Copper amine oxidase N-terminal domain-containing protein n=1 Tax=Paenibacillus haidiansis TaxID=1574488 RepID=A0ABU7VS94_9BACL